MLNILVRPSTKADGDAIISILDANVIWFRSIGSTQWGPELFSEDPTMCDYWKGCAGSGDLFGEGKAQTFVIEVEDTEQGDQRRVGGFYIMGNRWPKYVPDIDEPSLFIVNAAIHPDMRHKGLGSAMVSHAKDIASKLNTKVIRMESYGGTLVQALSCINVGTTAEGAKLVNAWVKLGFEKVAEVSPTGGERNDADPWQQILALRLSPLPLQNMS